MSIALLKNFSYYTLGQLITQLLSLLLLPLYLIKLSVEEYGIVASLMSVSIFLNALMQYGICPAIMRFYYDFEKKSKEFSGFFTSLLVYTIISNLILICFLFFFSNEVFNYFLPNIDITKYFYIHFYIIFPY
jgi:O-antigen/teichoic acid export membrane protein